MPFATDEELSILEFLGSSFYRADRLDAKRHWHTAPVVGAYDVVSDFTVSGSEGSVLTIRVSGRYRNAVNSANGFETGTLLYDTSLAAPKSIRLREQWGNGDVPEEEALDLVSDSAAGGAGPNPH
jgi:hypothetical protein